MSIPFVTAVQVQALPGVGGLRMVLLRNGRELDTLGAFAASRAWALAFRFFGWVCRASLSGFGVIMFLYSPLQKICYNIPQQKITPVLQAAIARP